MGLLGVGLGGIALEQAIPFGRVWSFPSKIVVPKPGDIISFASVNRVNPLSANDGLVGFQSMTPRVKVGDIISIAPYPQKFRITAVGESGFSMVTPLT